MPVHVWVKRPKYRLFVLCGIFHISVVEYSQLNELLHFGMVVEYGILERSSISDDVIFGEVGESGTCVVQISHVVEHM